MEKTEFKTLAELINYCNQDTQVTNNLTRKTTPFMNQTETRQESSLNNVRAGSFIVGSIDDKGEFGFSTIPVIHPNATSARVECKRLSSTNPGKAFIFVQLRGAELVPMNTSISI